MKNTYIHLFLRAIKTIINSNLKTILLVQQFSNFFLCNLNILTRSILNLFVVYVYEVQSGKKDLLSKFPLPLSLSLSQMIRILARIVGHFGISVHEEEDSAPISMRIMRHSSGGRKRAETEAGYLQDECQPQPWQSFPSIYIIAVVWTLFWLLTRARERGEGDMQIRISIIAGIALNGLLERGRQPFRVYPPVYRSRGRSPRREMFRFSRSVKDSKIILREEELSY